MVTLKTDGRTVSQNRTGHELRSSTGPARDLAEAHFPTLDTASSSPKFIARNEDSERGQHFFPHIKVHTQYGEDVTQIGQSTIPYASPEYRLRSDSLAQTLHIFARKVNEILPPDYSVHISLSPSGGAGSCDTVQLVRQNADGDCRPILKRLYSPFDGGSIGGIIPSDQARNVVLKIEERLFYYTTFLAIQAALKNSTSAS